MTTQQLILMNCFYFAVLATIAYFTRATSRRMAGVLAGAAAIALLALGMIALGEAMRLWEVPISLTVQLLLLLYMALTISCAPIYLISWRVARRFGWRGHTILVSGAAVIGPVRDYIVAMRNPEWIVFGPGIAPVIAVGTIYAMMVGVVHAVMRMVAGPSGEDRLVRRRWDAV